MALYPNVKSRVQPLALSSSIDFSLIRHPISKMYNRQMAYLMTCGPLLPYRLTKWTGLGCFLNSVGLRTHHIQSFIKAKNGQSVKKLQSRWFFTKIDIFPINWQKIAKSLEISDHQDIFTMCLVGTIIYMIFQRYFSDIFATFSTLVPSEYSTNLLPTKK